MDQVNEDCYLVSNISYTVTVGSVFVLMYWLTANPHKLSPSTSGVGLLEVKHLAIGGLGGGRTGRGLSSECSSCSALWWQKNTQKNNAFSLLCVIKSLYYQPCVKTALPTTVLLVLPVLSTNAMVLLVLLWAFDSILDLGRGTGLTLTSHWLPSVTAGWQQQQKSTCEWIINSEYTFECLNFH